MYNTLKMMKEKTKNVKHLVNWLWWVNGVDTVSTNMDALNQDNYSIDRPINFYLKRYVFEHSAWFVFCHVYGISVTYKIRQHDFDVIFLRNSSEKLSSFKCKLRCNKDIFQIICLYYEIRIILVYQSIFLKNFNIE